MNSQARLPLLTIQSLIVLFILCAASGCASQYQHHIKKTAEFNDDLEYCEREANKQGFNMKSASRDSSIDQCLQKLGWKDKRNICFSKTFETRMAGSEVCR